MRTKKGYKKTGVMIVDMVCACINHYEDTVTPVDRITLHPIRWKEFCDYVNKVMPEYEIDGSIDFDNVRITCGIDVMNESMYYYFKKPITTA
jgi:hypothetical protein